MIPALSRKFKQIRKAARLLALFRAVSFLPLSAAYALASVIGYIDAIFKNSYLSAVTSGMEYVKTGKFSLSQSQVQDYVKRHSQMMAREVLDSYRVPRLGVEQISRISSISGLASLRQSLQEGRGAIILVCHYSRLNMVALTLGHMGISTGIITQCVDRRNIMLDWVDRIYLQEKLRKYRQVSRGTLVTLEDNLRPIYKAISANEPVIMLMDAWHPRFRKFNHYPFLGGEIRLPAGALRIGMKTGAPMFYGVVRERGWQVDVALTDLPGPADTSLNTAVNLLEADVIERPWEWWQWYNIAELWKSEDFHAG